MRFDAACRLMLGQEPETVIGWFNSDESVPAALKDHGLRHKTLSCYAAGIWLHHALHKQGVPEQDADDACEAAGQMMVYEDPWKVAQKQYHQVIDFGIVTVPGYGLARALVDGLSKLEGRSRSDR